MAPMIESQKPHAVCVPYPAQGHVNPMLHLAKILNSKGFHITFVNTEYNHKRLLRALGPEGVKGLPSFQFDTIPDGLPPTENDNVTQHPEMLLRSTSTTCLTPFKELLAKLHGAAGVPPVSCVIADAIMSFTLDAAEELGIPCVLFQTTSACGFLGYVHYTTLLEKGLVPLKSDDDFTNGYLNTPVEFSPSLKGVRLKDLPTFCRTTNPDDFLLHILPREAIRTKRASAVIINTIHDLEQDVIHDLSSMYDPVYAIGPLHALVRQLDNKELQSIGSSLWKEDNECLDWLDSKEPGSVIYLNFGSLTKMTHAQLVEFSWGIADSNVNFLWVIRPDLVDDSDQGLPPEFLEETKGRGLLASWCPQDKVLNHPSVGGFLTHSGWNSTLESIAAGVPMLCWPYFAEQQTNCWWCCNRWGNGMEIDNQVDRKQVTELVRAFIVEEKGEEMKKMARFWKERSESDSSWLNIDKLINEVLLSSTNGLK